MSMIGKTAVVTLLLPLCAALFGAAVNVRDFGAKGDGKNDDTAAFQKAIDSVFAEYTFDSAPKSGREVLVPEGTYRLTRTLVFRNALVLRGEGRAVLVFSDPKKDGLYGAGRFGRFSNLTFRGGAHQLRFWTDNMDASCFDIMNCRFENSANAAVECNSQAVRSSGTDGGKKQKRPPAVKLPPWRLKKNGDFYDLSPVDLAGTAHFYNSTKLNVEDCVFTGCLHAVDCIADGVTIRRCRVVLPRESSGVFKLGTRAFLYDLDILVKKNDKLSPAVIETVGGILEMTDAVVKTDGRRDVHLIRHTRKGKRGGYLGDSIILQRIETPSEALIHSPGGAVPQILIVQQVTAAGGKPAKVFRFDAPFDEKTVDLSIPASYNRRFTPGQSFAFSFADNRNIDETMPAPLAPFVRKLRAKLPERIRFPEIPEFKGKVLDASNFGIGEKAASEDGRNLEKLFAEAAKFPGCTVILPGRDMLIRKTLNVPPDIHVTSAGCCHLIAKKADTVIFSVKDPRRVLVSNLVFSRGKHAVRIASAAGKKGVVVMRKCSGFDLTDAAVQAYSGSREVLLNSPLQFFFDGGLWITPLVYEGNADAVIDNQWIENKLFNHRMKKPIPDSAVVFVNYGKLELIDMLGVPLALRKGPRSGVAPAGTVPGDIRWADNHGVMVCRHNRFGGERGGMATIYHYGKARTRIYGGSSWCNNGYSYRVLGIVDGPGADFAALGVIVSPYIIANDAPDLVCRLKTKTELVPAEGRILDDIVPSRKKN